MSQCKTCLAPLPLEAQLSQKRAATAEVDSNSKRQKTQETEENGEGDTGVTDGNALQEWARSF